MKLLTRRNRTLILLIGFVTLSITTMMIVGLNSPRFVHSSPDMGEDCYCHSGLVARVEANGTIVSALSHALSIGVDREKSFNLLIKMELYERTGVVQSAIKWMPDMADNSKFIFDPQEVVDNSPSDSDPAAGRIVALFRIVAPKEAGSYLIAVSAQGQITTMDVGVDGAGIGPRTPQGFAAITDVEAPFAARTGESVRINATLHNKGTRSEVLYIYVTDKSAGRIVLNKVYSEKPVAGNATIALAGAFLMPNNNVTLTIHAGHVQEGKDVDDSAFAISVRLPLPLPQMIPLQILALEWAPWIVVVGASLASVPLVKSYGSRRKRLFPQKVGKLKLAVVDCALCGGCEIAVADLGDDLLDLLSTKIDLVFAPILMSARDYGPVDVAFVVGSVRTAEDLRIVKQARENAKVLVAFGTCPAFGGLHSLANLYPVEDLLDTAYVSAPSMEGDAGKNLPSTRVPELMNEVKPLSHYVKVDLTVPGCPPPGSTVRAAIKTLLDSTSRGSRE